MPDARFIWKGRMTLNRGDIVMTRFPHAGGSRGKKRPAVIIQSDFYNSRLKHFILAEITTNLGAASDPSSFLIDVTTPAGKSTGLDHTSVVCCLFLSTVGEGSITKWIGKLPDELTAQLDTCLKAALHLQ